MPYVENSLNNIMMRIYYVNFPRSMLLPTKYQETNESLVYRMNHLPPGKDEKLDTVQVRIMDISSSKY
jgi:hypothetical protein